MHRFASGATLGTHSFPPLKIGKIPIDLTLRIRNRRHLSCVPPAKCQAINQSINWHQIHPFIPKSKWHNSDGPLLWAKNSIFHTFPMQVVRKAGDVHSLFAMLSLWGFCRFSMAEKSGFQDLRHSKTYAQVNFA